MRCQILGCALTVLCVGPLATAAVPDGPNHVFTGRGSIRT